MFCYVPLIKYSIFLYFQAFGRFNGYRRIAQYKTVVETISWHISASIWVSCNHAWLGMKVLSLTLLDFVWFRKIFVHFQISWSIYKYWEQYMPEKHWKCFFLLIFTYFSNYVVSIDIFWVVKWPLNCPIHCLWKIWLFSKNGCISKSFPRIKIECVKSLSDLSNRRKRSGNLK